MTAPTDPEAAPYALVRHREHLAVVPLAVGADLPAWASSGTVLSVTATAAGTTVVCAMAEVPHKARPHGPYVAFEVQGPLDLALFGVLARLLAPLAEAQVPIFTVSTVETDWILVPADRADEAAQAWQHAGHAVSEGVGT